MRLQLHDHLVRRQIISFPQGRTLQDQIKLREGRKERKKERKKKEKKRKFLHEKSQVGNLLLVKGAVRPLRVVEQEVTINLEICWGINESQTSKFLSLFIIIILDLISPHNTVEQKNL